jgi:hypothetical protein
MTRPSQPFGYHREIEYEHVAFCARPNDEERGRAARTRMDTSTTKKIYTVDGSRFSTLVECAAEFTRVLELTMPWNGNLDAFNDFLRGGFGTSDEGFVLIWQHSDLARQWLGHGETLRWLEERVHHCHPTNVAHFRSGLQQHVGKRARYCSIRSRPLSATMRI